MSFMGERHGASDYLDILALPGFKQKSADIFIDYLALTALFRPARTRGNGRRFLHPAIADQTLRQRREGSGTGSSRNISARGCRSTPGGKTCRVLALGLFQTLTERLNKIASFEFRVISNVNEIPAAFECLLRFTLGGGSTEGGHQPSGLRSRASRLKSRPTLPAPA